MTDIASNENNFKKTGAIIAALGFVGLAGTFFPLANAGTLNMSVSNLGGVLPLLYVIPVVVMVVGVMSYLGKMSRLPHVLVPISVLAVIIVGLGTYAAMSHLAMMTNGAFGQMMNGLGDMSARMGMEKIQIEKPSIGAGSLSMIATYVGVSIVSFIKSSSR